MNGFQIYVIFRAYQKVPNDKVEKNTKRPAKEILRW